MSQLYEIFIIKSFNVPLAAQHAGPPSLRRKAAFAGPAAPESPPWREVPPSQRPERHAKIEQRYIKIVNLVEIGALNRAGASDRHFGRRARKRERRHICRYRKYPPKNLDLRIGPVIFAEKNMIRNFNIQAWWWRSLTLVDNECGSVRV